MTAAFDCPVCRRELTAADGDPGLPVTCPQCGERTAPPGAGMTGDVCPRCDAAVGPGAAACPACGELLGPLSDGLDGAARPTAGTLGGVFAAALRDYRRRWGLLGSGWLLAALFWGLLFVTQCVAGYGTAIVADMGFGIGLDAIGFGFLAYGVAALLNLPLNGGVIVGLAGLHLAVARREVPKGRRRGEGAALSPLWRTRGRRRTVLCGVIVLLFGAGLAIASSFLADVGLDVTFGRSVQRWYWEGPILVAAVAVPLLVLWLLFWPLAFLIADRPDLRGVRPLWVCFTLPSGRWGGHLAAGTAGLAVAFAPAFAVGLVLLGDLLAWGNWWESETVNVLMLLLVPPAFLVTLPAGGLLLAHAYDRCDRAETDETGPRPLDPGDLI